MAIIIKCSYLGVVRILLKRMSGIRVKMRLKGGVLLLFEDILYGLNCRERMTSRTGTKICVGRAVLIVLRKHIFKSRTLLSNVTLLRSRDFNPTT